MKYRFILLVNILTVLTSFIFPITLSAQNQTFKFEPTRKATAISSAPLKIGDVIEVQSKNIKKNETLILQRCGEPCNTAKHISHWKLADFEAYEKHKVNLIESGQYYFWIQKITEKGEMGPVFGDFEKIDGTSVVLHFVSGTEIRVQLR